MTVERPDLSQVDPSVRTYIEALESEIEQLRAAEAEPEVSESAATPSELVEPPTTINVITISAGGLAKRTPRHLYFRQRRGGMGVFDLEAPEDDRPTFLALAEESHSLIAITTLARAFRARVSDLPESPVHGRGQSLTAAWPMQRDERLAAVLPAREGGYLAVLSWRGYVRCLHYHLFGEGMAPGVRVYDVKEFGMPVAACWTAGDSDVFVATRRGNAIRFNETSVPVAGCLGIRLDPEDAAMAIAAVRPDGAVFLLGSDGRGTIRLMPGFAPNKAPGGSGKLALRTGRLVAAIAVDAADDLFILSRLGKIIRFRTAEVPAKEGVVQGVNCMALRADESTAAVNSPAV